MLERVGLWLFAEAEVEDLHLFFRQLFVIVLNDQINESIGHQHVIEVFEITFQLVIKWTISKTIENFLAFLNWLVTQYDLFDFFVGLDKDIDVKWVELLVVWKQTLKLE